LDPFKRYPNSKTATEDRTGVWSSLVDLYHADAICQSKGQ
jgi:hypothetical protein